MSTHLRFLALGNPPPKPEKCLLGISQTMIRKEADATMANRKRNIQVKFYVTAEAKKLMEQKMAIDGYIIYVDTRDIKEMNKLLSAIGRNINQIAKRVNTGGPT